MQVIYLFLQLTSDNLLITLIGLISDPILFYIKSWHSINNLFSIYSFLGWEGQPQIFFDHTNILVTILSIWTLQSLQKATKRTHYFDSEMGPDPTRAYFWPTANKRPACLWPKYFLTRPEEIFFYPKGKKLKNLGFSGGNFPNPYSNQRRLTRPHPSNKKLTQRKPGHKFWPRSHHYFDFSDTINAISKDVNLT